MAKYKKDTKKVAMTGAERMKKYRGDPRHKYKVDLAKKRTVRRQLAKLKQKSDNSEGTLRVVIARKFKSIKDKLVEKRTEVDGMKLSDGPPSPPTPTPGPTQALVRNISISDTDRGHLRLQSQLPGQAWTHSC